MYILVSSILNNKHEAKKMRTNLNHENLIKALEITNKKFGNNILFNRLEQSGKWISFTLKVKDSKKEGSRIGFTGRRVAKACWHVHGELFDAMFELDSNTIIYSRGEKITKENNWTDVNIGSMFRPLYFSEACNC